GFVVVADAFGAQGGVDDVDLLALGDGAVGAFGFADVAVDAVVGDLQGHVTAPATAARRGCVTRGADYAGFLSLAGLEATRQRLGHGGVDEVADVPTQGGDLAHQGGGNVGIFFRRGEEHALHVRHQLTVHVGQLELVLEVRHRA